MEKQIFNAREVNQRLVEGKCACGNELTNPEHTTCLDCWKKARGGANAGQRMGFNSNNQRAAVGQAINLAHSNYMMLNRNPFSDLDDFRQLVDDYKKLSEEIQKTYEQNN